MLLVFEIVSNVVQLTFKQFNQWIEIMSGSFCAVGFEFVFHLNHVFQISLHKSKPFLATESQITTITATATH